MLAAGCGLNVTLSVQAAQNNLYVGGGGEGGQVELSKDYYTRERQLCQGYRAGCIYSCIFSCGMDRIDNCCKYNATNWSRMSVSKKTKNVCFVLFSVPAS